MSIEDVIQLSRDDYIWRFWAAESLARPLLGPLDFV